MKKLFALIIGFIMLASMVTAAPPVPAPVVGTFTINGNTASGYIVEVENLGTGDIISGAEKNTLITENGKFTFDFSDFPNGYFSPKYRTRNGVKTLVLPGDLIEIRIRGAPDAVYEFNVPEDTPYYFQFGLDDVTPQSVTYYVCWDKTTVNRKELCPEQPKPTPAPKPKPVIIHEPVRVPTPEPKPVPVLPKTEPDEPSEALVIALGIVSSILALAVGILAKFKWGKGFVGLANYYVNKGNEAKKKGDFNAAKRYYSRAASMVSTAIKKAKDGFYK